MTWEPRSPKWPWRDFLTPEEARIVNEADAVLKRCRRESATASAVRAPIQNRAIHRAKYGKQG